MREFLVLGSTLLLAANVAASDAFRDMDRDGNRVLTAAEHVDGTRAMFREMDADRDEIVTAEEMTAAQEAITGRPRAEGEMTSEEKIAEIDKDRDGRLSAKEHAAGARRSFDRMDADRNGTLSEAEYLAAQALKKKRRK